MYVQINKKAKFKKLQLACFASLSLLSFTASALVQEGMSSIQSQASLNTNAKPTGRIIVKYKNEAPENQVTALSAKSIQGISHITGRDVTYMRKLATGAHLIKTANNISPEEYQTLLTELAADPNVEYAEPDLLLKPMATPNDARYSEQWDYFDSVAGINMPAAWDLATGTGVVVAVIDTGYRPHADLAANIIPGYDMINDADTAQDGGGRDSDAKDPGDYSPAGACEAGSPSENSSWHGTHVAGTIAAVTNNGTGIAGIAYNAKVLPVRVLGRCGGYTSDIADGMIWAAGGTVSGAPANPTPAKVLNLSLGGGGACGATQQNAINTARSLGATVVVAAGNENQNASNSNPANCTGVVVVAATGKTGGRASYSNYGANVDVAAPGGDGSYGILSTLNSGATTPGSDSYASYQGTSMATPHVAGVVALMYSVKPSITPDQVESILKSTARAFPATCNQCGSGIIDAAAAVAAAGGTVVVPPSTKLENGVAKTSLTGATNSEQGFTLEVPTGVTSLSFKISGGTGDADLYVKFGSAPTTSSYDCRPYVGGNAETCTITNIQAGTYYVMIKAYAAYSGLSLVANYSKGTTGGNGSINQTNLSGAVNTWKDFTLDIAAGTSALNVVMSGGSGDADLYVRFGSQSTSTTYDCRPYKTGNSETCTINNPQAGTWHISLFGYAAYSGVTLKATAP